MGVAFHETHLRLLRGTSRGRKSGSISPPIEGTELCKKTQYIEEGIISPTGVKGQIRKMRHSAELKAEPTAACVVASPTASETGQWGRTRHAADCRTRLRKLLPTLAKDCKPSHNRGRRKGSGFWRISWRATE